MIIYKEHMKKTMARIYHVKFYISYYLGIHSIIVLRVNIDVRDHRTPPPPPPPKET